MVDWFMMRPCTGVVGVCPPLCTWGELNDGTYTLGDVLMFNNTIDEIIRIQHVNAQR